MDIIDFLLKTVFEIVGWIFMVLINLILAIFKGIFNLIGDLFNKS